MCSFPQISGYFWKFFTLWKSCSEEKKVEGTFHLISAELITLWKLFDCAEVFLQNLQHKGDISFDCQKKCILVVISYGLNLCKSGHVLKIETTQNLS